MERRSALTQASNGTADIRNLMSLSITQLISKLRTAFRVVDYNRVEETLVSKETKLKAEIKALNEKLEVARLERMNIEEQLQKYKEQSERGKKAEQRYERLLEAVKKKNGMDDGNTIAELRIQIRKLEDEKRRAESAVKSLKIKFAELNERLLAVEKGAEPCTNGDNHDRIRGNAEELSGARRITDDTRPSPDTPNKAVLGASGISTEAMDKKEMNEADMHGHECGSAPADSSSSQRKTCESGNTDLAVNDSTRQSLDTPNKDVLSASEMTADTPVEIEGNTEEASEIQRNTDPAVPTKVIDEKEMNVVICGHTTVDSSPSQRKACMSGDTHICVEGTRQLPVTPNKAVLDASEMNADTLVEIGANAEELSGSFQQANGSSGLQKDVIEIEDSDDDKCISSGTLSGKEATVGVDDKTGTLKRKWFPESANSSGGLSINPLDTDDESSSSASSAESEFNEVQLPPNFLCNTVDKRRKT